MSDFDGNFMEATLLWAPPASPSPRSIFALLNHIEDGVNPFAEIFPQPIDQSEPRSGLGERLAARIEFNPPTLVTDNISPYASFFRSSNNVSSPLVPISPGFSPSALLLSPNMLPDSSQINPPFPMATSKPQEMVESCGEGNATTMISENDLPHHEPMNVDLPPPQEGSDDIPTEETRVEPLDAMTVLQTNLPSHVVKNEPQEMVESHGEGNAAKMISEKDVTHHEPMNVDLPPPQEGSDKIPIEEAHVEPLDDNIPMEESHVEPLDAPLVTPFQSELVDPTNSVNIISIIEESEVSEDEESEESEDEDEDEDYDDDDEDEDDEEDDDVEEDKDEDTVDKQDVKPPSPKRRKFEVSSNMVGASRASKTQRVIIQMESDEDHPDDGFRWRKYGQKVVKGNPNPRSYYKCTHEGCEVKKLVERGAEDINIVVTTYDGIHEHNQPVARSSGSKTRSSSSMPSDQDQTNQTTQLGRSPNSGYDTSEDAMMTTTPFTSLAPQMDMTQVYMTGLSKLPSLPVNQNAGFMYRNDEPRNDAIHIGTDVYQMLSGLPSLPVNQNTGFMYRNDEPMIDANATHSGANVYNEIMSRLLFGFGARF